MEVNEYIKATSLEEASNLLKQSGNQLIGGGAWMKLSLKKAEKLISLDLLQLDQIKLVNDKLVIGSMVSLREIEKSEAVLNISSGLLSQAVSHVMGINVRNIATIGGTIMAKLAFSDVLPALLVLDCQLIFHEGGKMSLEEFLFNKQVMKDILIAIEIPLSNNKAFFKKVATTRLDFAIINFAVANSNTGIKIAIGATPYIAQLAHRAMDYLNKANEINDTVIENTVKLVLDEIKVSSNMRGSKEYRTELIKAYVKRGIRQVI